MTEINSENFSKPPLSGGLKVPPLERRTRHHNPLREALRRLVIHAGIMGADLLAGILAFSTGFIVSIIYRTAIGAEAHTLTTWLGDRGSELILIMIMMLGIFTVSGLYSRVTLETEETKRIIMATGVLALFDAAMQFWLNEHSSRLWFFVAWPMFAMFSIFLRGGVRTLPIMRRAMTSHLLMVGTGISRQDFTHQMRESQTNPVNVIDVLTTDSLTGHTAEGLMDTLLMHAKNAGLAPDRVQIMLVPSWEERHNAREIVGLLEEVGIPFNLALPPILKARSGLRMKRLVGLDSVLAEFDPFRRPLLELFLKRSMDIGVSALALAALSPLLILIAAILRLEGGPALFRQSRVGRGGTRFACLKFRSMRVDAQDRLRELLQNDPAARAQWDEHQKLAKDPRITRFGAFLRTTSLDELPQLFNILTGKMSLVGPRPIIAPEVEGYPGDRAYYDTPEFSNYLSCRPGLTGLWQVSGRARNTYEERIRLDVWYARNRSLWLDIAIIFKTIRVVLFSKTAS